MCQMRKKMTPSWQCSTSASTCWKAQRYSSTQIESSSKQSEDQSPTVLDYVLKNDHDAKAGALARRQVLLSHSNPAHGLAHGKCVRANHLGLHLQSSSSPVNCNLASGSPAPYPGPRDRAPGSYETRLSLPHHLPDYPRHRPPEPCRTIVGLSNKLGRLLSGKSKGLDFDHLVSLGLRKSSGTIYASRRSPCPSQPPKSSPVPSTTC